MSEKREQGVPPEWEMLGPEVRQLVEVIAKLRSPEGCPWDRVQTMETIKPYTLEETYELLEAIDSNDNVEICEELGDVLLQVVLDAQIAADEGRFSLTDVVRVIKEKMIRRHPHVFGDVTAATAGEVSANWQKIKKAEKPKRTSLLDGLPKDLPALAKAARIQKKAADVGYDFPHRDMLFDKLKEEMGELCEELYGAPEPPMHAVDVNETHTKDVHISDDELKHRVENELGDILFVLANIARRFGVNPEEALRKTNAKFTRRFQAIERGLAAAGIEMGQATLVEMEEHYQLEKAREKSSLKTV